jgi:hypothetical protein
MQVSLRFLVIAFANSLVDDVHGSYILNAIASAEFIYETAKRRLIDLDLDISAATNMTLLTPAVDLRQTGLQWEGTTDRQGQLMRLGSYINMDSIISVGFHHPLQCYCTWTC